MAVRSALMNVMQAAARKAARGLIRDFGEVENLQVSRKGPADFVSAADLRAEKILREELTRVRPKFGFELEEGGRVEAPDGEHYWLVDPLDGTTNFLHGLPHFAISIGLKKGDDVIAAVIHDPIKDEMFWAEKGSGAWLNERRLRVSARTKLPDSLLATGIPFHGVGNHDRVAVEIRQIMDQVAGIRRFGAAALDLAYVAAGRYEGFWEHNLKPWDIAAGLLMVREAGGKVTDFAGTETMLASGDIVATNGVLHDDLKALLDKAQNRVARG